jgi:hypothetical protein
LSRADAPLASVPVAMHSLGQPVAPENRRLPEATTGGLGSARPIRPVCPKAWYRWRVLLVPTTFVPDEIEAAHVHLGALHQEAVTSL